MCLYSISNSTNCAMIDKNIQFYIHQQILQFPSWSYILKISYNFNPLEFSEKGLEKRMMGKLLLQLPLKLLGEGIMILFLQLWGVCLGISFIPLKCGCRNNIYPYGVLTCK